MTFSPAVIDPNSNASLGINLVCPKCGAEPGRRCIGNGTRQKVTHQARFQAALYAPGSARKYVTDTIAGRVG